MKKRILITLIIILSGSILISADIRHIKDGYYINNLFKLKIQIPEKFHALSEKKRMLLMAQSAQILAGDDKNLKSLLQSSKLNTINLFSFFRYPLGKPVSFNYSILAVAENIELYKEGLKKEEDYFYHTKKLLNQSSLKYTFSDKVLTRKIGDQTFKEFFLYTKINNIKINQKYFCLILDNYVISIVISYLNDEQLKELEKILQSIEMKK